MNEFWNYFLFKIGNQDITLGQIILSVILVVIIYSSYRRILKKYFPQLSERSELPAHTQQKMTSLLRGFALVVLLLGIVLSLKLNYTLHSFESFDLTVILIIKALFFVQAARLLFWFISNVFIHSYYVRRDQRESTKNNSFDKESSVKRIIKSIFYTIIVLFVLNNFEIDPTIFKRRINDDLFF